MSLVSIIISLVVVGVLLWLINTYVPMDGKIKKIVNIVVVVVVVLWLLSVFGIIDHVRGIHVSSFIQAPSACSLVSPPGLAMNPAVATPA
jgi:small-conductance mechanosensitive channel